VCKSFLNQWHRLSSPCGQAGKPVLLKQKTFLRIGDLEPLSIFRDAFKKLSSTDILFLCLDFLDEGKPQEK